MNLTEAFQKGFDQILKICEYEMITASVMKKQYQNIFALNEKEKQKCTRSRRLIQHEEGLTREEAQNFISPSNPSVESIAIQSYKPEAPASRPRLRAPQRCSNCGTIGHTRIRCPNPSIV